MGFSSGPLLLYPRVWEGDAPSMTTRYEHIKFASGGVEPNATARGELVAAAFGGAPLPDLSRLMDGFDRVIVGCGTDAAVRFALAIAEFAPDRVIMSWHDPMDPANRELETRAARACKYHFCPTRPHGQLLRSLGAERVSVCTALLDNSSIPQAASRTGWDITHFGWVGRNGRDLPGLVRGVSMARRREASWRVVQFGALPKGMPLSLLRYRLLGSFSHQRAVPKSRVSEVYGMVRGAAILQVGGYFGEMCIPGKLIEAALNGVPVICDRRGKLLAQVCDAAGIGSWSAPADIPDLLEDIDRHSGAAFVAELGKATADQGIADAYRSTLAERAPADSSS